jgi:hypothetical protein
MFVFELCVLDYGLYDTAQETGRQLYDTLCVVFVMIQVLTSSNLILVHFLSVEGCRTLYIFAGYFTAVVVSPLFPSVSVFHSEVPFFQRFLYIVFPALSRPATSLFPCGAHFSTVALGHLVSSILLVFPNHTN